MSNTLYTIGYSGYATKDFLFELKTHGVNAVIDVRSTPFSEYFKDYDKPNLERILNPNRIYYRSYASQFGARQTNPNYFNTNGILDFEKYSRTQVFKLAVDLLLTSMDQGYAFALMCAEKDPMTCHRSILIGRAFQSAGCQVVHLMPGGLSETQSELEERLVDKFFPTRNQISLFGDRTSDDQYLESAYRRQNTEIGYRLPSEP